MLLTLDGHHVQAKRIEAQWAAALPLHKRLWAAVVKCKLEQQAAALEGRRRTHGTAAGAGRQGQSGDPENIEGQGARRYWGLLFGAEFRRDQDGDGINALLNYGYTILRSATARAVVAAGLHPSIGLHHSNDANAMRLVDDLMEPFRPMVDLKVWQLHQAAGVACHPGHQARFGARAVRRHAHGCRRYTGDGVYATPGHFTGPGVLGNAPSWTCPCPVCLSLAGGQF